MIYRVLRHYLMTDPTSWGTISAEDQAAKIAARLTIAATVAGRIYPIKVPQGATYPVITIRRISGSDATHLHGASSLVGGRWQVDSWTHERSGASAFNESQVIGAAVKTRLEAFSGVVIDPGSGSPLARYRLGITFDQEREAFSSDVNGGYFGHQADFMVWASRESM